MSSPAAFTGAQAAFGLQLLGTAGGPRHEHPMLGQATFGMQAAHYLGVERVILHISFLLGYWAPEDLLVTERLAAEAAEVPAVLQPRQAVPAQHVSARQHLHPASFMTRLLPSNCRCWESPHTF